MAELADAYGSGPYESNFMQVQVLLSAPSSSQTTLVCDDISFFVEKSPPTSFRCSSSPQNARRFGVPHVLDLIGLFVFSILIPAILSIICITPQAFLNRPAALFDRFAVILDVVYFLLYTSNILFAFVEHFFVHGGMCLIAHY